MTKWTDNFKDYFKKTAQPQNTDAGILKNNEYKEQFDRLYNWH
jgi:hypothetical protein